MVKDLPNRIDLIKKKEDEFIIKIKDLLNPSQLISLNNLINKN